MLLYLLNSVSLNMLGGRDTELEILWLPAEMAGEIATQPIINAIGHPDTDRVVRRMLGGDLPVGSRQTVELRPGDRALVAQYRGPRLPEGATELPEGAKIDFALVHVAPRNDGAARAWSQAAQTAAELSDARRRITALESKLRRGSDAAPSVPSDQEGFLDDAGFGLH